MLSTRIAGQVHEYLLNVLLREVQERLIDYVLDYVV